MQHEWGAARSSALLFAGNKVSFVGGVYLPPNEPPTNLSEDGARVFFDSEEALVPQDDNGQLNVYEWEREGAGSCATGQGGCLYLISTGQSADPSFFAGAGGPNGNNVLFFTRQSLVGQDTDENVDVYDARIGGGLAAQTTTAPVAPCLGEECRASQTPNRRRGHHVSQVFSGPGNLMSVTEPVPVSKAKAPSKTVKKKKKKKKDKTRKRQRKPKRSHATRRSHGRRK